LLDDCQNKEENNKKLRKEVNQLQQTATDLQKK